MNNRIYFFILTLLIAGISGVNAQNLIIKGRVLDEYKEGLPGTNISVKGTTTGVTCDFDGNYSIAVPDKNAVLIFSFIGYKNQEVKVGNQTVINVQLESQSQMVDEVVIVGFGSQKKINATGAVKTIDNKALESRPITSAAEGLQGVIAGLNITNDMGGAPGQDMQINIRGLGSIGEGSSASPLVLIDGIEGDISSINPNDIQNISLLKDAAAAAIYGSRAPFGVLLITTKSGEKGTSFTYSGNMRISRPINLPDPVDSYTYALMVNDAFINAGEGAQFGEAQLNKILKYQRGELPFGTEKHPTQNQWLSGQQTFGNTNWYDEHINKVAISQEHNASLSGGGDKTTYYFSANYLNQNGMFRHADDFYNRFSINGKFNVKILEQLNFNWNTRLVVSENNKPTALNDLFFHNLGRRAPNVPVYLPNGEYNPESLIPALQEGGRNIAKNQVVYNQASLTYEPIKNWKIYGEIGSRLETPRDTRQIKTLETTLPDGTKEYVSVFEGVNDKSQVNTNGSFTRQPAAGVNYYEKGNGFVSYLNSNIRTDYELTKNKHYFKALVGMQTEYFKKEMTRVSSDEILIDDTPFLPSPTGTNTMISERKGEWSTVGFFGRVNYSFDNRYMVEANVRTDGASRFPKDKRWGVFPSFSLGWNVAQEAFWSPLAEKGFETFKLRGSYGMLGNQNTTSFYPYFQQMESGRGNVVMDGSIVDKLPAPAPFSTNITWEKIENSGFGVDLGLFQNRFNATFDWYRRVTKDMVGPAKQLPNIFGATAPKENNAELTTKGWELEVSYRDRIGKNFTYDITATLSDYQSVVTKYDSPDGKLDGFYKGKNLGDIWGYQVEGIAKSDQQMNAWLGNSSQSSLGSNWGAGDFMYKDVDGTGSVDAGGNSVYDHGDLSIIGNGTPRYAYGIRLNMKYKFVDFGMFFQGIGKRDLFLKGSATFFGFSAPWQRTLLTDHLDYFRPAGDPLGANLDSYYARLRTTENNRHVNDHYMQDASYLRLKNVQIGFTLPSNTKVSKYLKNARLYVSGENLLTFTKLMILDPEAVGSDASPYGAGKTYPMNSVYSIGLSMTF